VQRWVSASCKNLKLSFSLAKNNSGHKTCL
jgi:hypothetical protein